MVTTRDFTTQVQSSQFLGILQNILKIMIFKSNYSYLRASFHSALKEIRLIYRNGAMVA